MPRRPRRARRTGPTRPTMRAWRRTRRASPSSGTPRGPVRARAGTRHGHARASRDVRERGERCAHEIERATIFAREVDHPGMRFRLARTRQLDIVVRCGASPGLVVPDLDDADAFAP